MPTVDLWPTHRPKYCLIKFAALLGKQRELLTHLILGRHELVSAWAY